MYYNAMIHRRLTLLNEHPPTMPILGIKWVLSLFKPWRTLFGLVASFNTLLLFFAVIFALFNQIWSHGRAGL